MRPDEIDPRIGELVSWLGGLNHRFSVLQGIPLRSDLCGPRGSTCGKTNVSSSIDKGNEMVHVHVQCAHGFTLISGIRDDTLRPACFLTECKEEGESWLRSQGLVDPSVTTAEGPNVVGSDSVLPVWVPCRHGAVLLHDSSCGTEPEHPDHTRCGRAACHKGAQHWWSTEGSTMSHKGPTSNRLLSAAQQRMAADWKLYLDKRQLGVRFAEDPVQERITYTPLPSVKVWWSARQVPAAKRHPSATLIWSEDMHTPSRHQKKKASKLKPKAAQTTAGRAEGARLCS